MDVRRVTVSHGQRITRERSRQNEDRDGLKETIRLLDRDFSVVKDPLGDGNWLPTNLTNNFNFDERVHAGYGVLSQTVGKFDLQAGLRAEFANRDFQLANAQSYPYKYHSLFPSGVIMYKPGEQSQVKVSYSRRIRRPGTQELNPFPVFFDQQNVFLGNPSLKPEYTDAYEFSSAVGAMAVRVPVLQADDIHRVDSYRAGSTDVK